MNMIDKTRLNYMQAWIKEYDDGTQILQSYNTDVVKKTPEGKYIRLCGGSSVTTSKQVRTWCGRSLRDIPFEDGTIEKYKSEYKLGYTVEGYADNAYHKDNVIEVLSEHTNAETICNLYNTGIHKKIKDLVKGDEYLTDLVMTAKACAIGNKDIRLGKTPEVKNKFDVIAKLYDYNIRLFIKKHEEETLNA